MKHKKLKLSLLFLALGLTIQAQQATMVSGGNANGSGGSAAYSIGQIVYTSYSGSNGSLTQGVQQAAEKFTLGIEDPITNLKLEAYPNPTTNYIILKVGNDDFSSLTFQLVDVMGRIIKNQKITKENEVIQLEGLPSAIYFLKITNKNNLVKTFKIIKN
tara:strand:- start:315 stop:791 length:477 start_codon:yes stop_codon:yes gene_type:complete